MGKPTTLGRARGHSGSSSPAHLTFSSAAVWLRVEPCRRRWRGKNVTSRCLLCAADVFDTLSPCRASRSFSRRRNLGISLRCRRAAPGVSLSPAITRLLPFVDGAMTTPLGTLVESHLESHGATDQRKKKSFVLLKKFHQCVGSCN